MCVCVCVCVCVSTNGRAALLCALTHLFSNRCVGSHAFILRFVREYFNKLCVGIKYIYIYIYIYREREREREEKYIICTECVFSWIIDNIHVFNKILIMYYLIMY